MSDHHVAEPPHAQPAMAPPAMTPPVMTLPGSVTSPARSLKGARRKGLLGLGLVLLVGGLGAGVATAARAQNQYDDAAARLQRAPVGCDTELTFSGTGTFVFFIETTGKIGDLPGDCPFTNSTYQRRANHALPLVDLTLVDTSGNDVQLARRSGTSYDAGGFAGTSTRELTLAAPGTYTLTVQSDDTDFAIAVGRDPQADFDQQRVIAIALGAGGLLFGGVVTIMGLRRKPVVSAPNVVQQPVTWAPTVVSPSVGQPVAGPPVELPPAQFAPPTWEPPHPSE